LPPPPPPTHLEAQRGRGQVAGAHAKSRERRVALRRGRVDEPAKSLGEEDEEEKGWGVLRCEKKKKSTAGRRANAR
jgi:hypothetical protein